MAKFSNAMEIFKLLKKDNCRDCGKPTCLAFAAAVYQGQMMIVECPHIPEEIKEKYGNVKESNQPEIEKEYLDKVEEYQEKIKTMDLKSRAELIGGRFEKNKLIIKILGKDFLVDQEGKLFSDIHINLWITIPFYEYVINSKGLELKGKWVPLRELKKGADWSNFFTHRCEKPLKRIADNYTHFFKDIIEIFNGKEVEKHYDADISLVMYPFPKVPFLVCYHEPEDGMDSDLNLFFDETASDNLGEEFLYRLATGLAVMFEKLARTHG